jgi:hypothetical protein
MLNLPSPFLGFGWVVLEIFTRDQRCRDEPVKGLLDAISSSTVFGTLLTHDDLEGLLGFNAASKIQNESLSNVSVQTLLNLHYAFTHSVGGTQAVDGGKDGTVDLTLEVPTRLVGDLQEADNRLGILLWMLDIKL